MSSVNHLLQEKQRTRQNPHQRTKRDDPLMVKAEEDTEQRDLQLAAGKHLGSVLHLCM